MIKYSNEYLKWTFAHRRTIIHHNINKRGEKKRLNEALYVNPERNKFTICRIKAANGPSRRNPVREIRPKARTVVECLSHPCFTTSPLRSITWMEAVTKSSMGPRMEIKVAKGGVS